MCWLWCRAQTGAPMMQAIQTRYRGYHFRSRLEARWAVFFDALNVAWEYEIEGFELPSGRYLPDFKLGHDHRWVEVKPAGITNKELIKPTKSLCDLLKLKMPSLGIIVEGCPGQYSPPFIAGNVDGEVWCGLDSKRFHTPRPICTMSLFVQMLGAPGDTDQFMRACNAAKSARFEFGESGAT